MHSVKDLRDAYKSFKMEHPVRNAKLPYKIRQIAASLVRNGETPETLSKQIGVTKDCVRHWLLKKKPIKKKVSNRSKNQETKVSTKREAPAQKNIKVKINGLELVTTKEDLRALLGI